MTEQQREAFEAWYNEEYVRPIIPADRTEGGYQHPDAQAAWDAWQAALSHAEGEAPFAYCFTDVNGRPSELTGPPEHAAPEDKRVITALYRHPAPQLAGLTETAIKSSPAYRKLHREKDHLLGLLKEQAPQVAVPAGYTLVPEDMLTHFRDFHDAVKTLSKTADPDGYWEHQCEVCKRIESRLAAAPTAPAGETEPDVADIELGHVIEWAEAVGCVEVEPRHDDAEFLVARAILDARRQQPVSDPDGLGEETDRIFKLRNVIKNARERAEFAAQWNDDTEVRYQNSRIEAAEKAISAPAPDEREMAAKALDDFMFDVAERVRLLSDSDLEARVLRKVNGWLHSRAARLRAGKKGE